MIRPRLIASLLALSSVCCRPVANDHAVADNIVADSVAYTLYRNSNMDKDARIHIASYDTDEGATFNHQNCEAAAELLSQRFAEDYWCEIGSFRYGRMR